MSTLKTHNLQSPDAGSVNIVMTPNAGMVVTGLSTFSNHVFLNSDLVINDVISHFGDGNTKIRFPADDNISFETAGSDRLHIRADGKVGINQGSSIQTRLHVSENIADSTALNWANSTMSLSSVVGGNSTANRSTLYFAPYNAANQNCPSAISCTAETNYQSTLKFFTNVAGNGTGHLTSYERLRIESDGDVGIGTNSPVERLHVHKASATGPFMYITNTSTGVSASDGIQIGYDGTNTAVFKNNEPTDLVFYAGSQNFRITSSGHVLPATNNTQDLGSTAKGWRNVYMNDLNLSNMNGDTNDVDGTQGSWTIQEGKDDLYIINRLNGKKFKIKMEEIS